MGRGNSKGGDSQSVMRDSAASEVSSDAPALDENSKYRILGVFKGELVYVNIYSPDSALLAFTFQETKPLPAAAAQRILDLANDDPELRSVRVEVA